MQSHPTGTVTLLFTDIEGSTNLLQRLGGEQYAVVLAVQRDLLRHVFHAFHGHEVDTQGDAFFVVFARATDAVMAAVDGQRALANHPWPDGVTVRVRMGLHTGEPVLATEGYVGLDVHHAARIMSAAHGGQVLLSQTTRELVVQALPSLPDTYSKQAVKPPEVSENLLYQKRKAKRHPMFVFWNGKQYFKEARLWARRRMSKSQSRPSRKILLSRRSTRSKRWRCP